MTAGRGPLRDGWAAAAIGATLFAIYAVGACRTIYVGDSGELAAAVDTLGIPHPSGYPLYILLGKAWTMLVPLGSIALRLSLFSAACAAAACAVLYLVRVPSRTSRLGGSSTRTSVWSNLICGDSLDPE